MTPNATQLVGLEQVKKKRGWFLILGILLVIAGTVAIGEAFIMTVFSMKFFGWILIFAGISTAVHACSMERGWGGFFLNLITGILYLVAGYVILTNPMRGAVVFTLIISMLLIFEGLFRAITAISARFPHWGWVFLSGAVTFILGILISRGWPLTGLWVIGLYVGISMILNGWSLIMLSIAVKNLPDGEGEAPTEAAA